jgi:hypothetical protein
MEEIMKCAVAMASGGMIYIPNVMKIGTGVQNLLGGYTHRQQYDLISPLLCLKNKESRLMMKYERF